MDEDKEILRVLADSPHRIEILEAVDDGPIAASDLSDELGLPRATTKHNLTRLAEAELIQSVGSQYLITTFGTYALSQIDDCLAGIATSKELLPFLSLVPPEAFDIDPSSFGDASVTTLSATAPHAPVERLRELIAEATYIRMVTPVLYPQVVDCLLDRIVSRDLHVDLIAPSTVLKRAYDRTTMSADRAFASERLLVGCYLREIPFGLFRFENRIALAGHNDENIMRCLVDSRSQPALEWGADRFRRYERDIEQYLTDAPEP